MGLRALSVAQHYHATRVETGNNCREQALSLMTILHPLRCKTGVVRTRPGEIRSPNRPTRVMGRDHQAWADSR